MTEQEIREQLHAIGATDAQIDRWLAAGLPHKLVDGGREFNRDQVAAWLLEHKIVESIEDTQQQKVVRTIPEVASYFGVSKNAVIEWTRQPGFPGTVGERGRQNGRFPLEEIAEWKAARDGMRQADQVGNTARERKWEADAAIRELELAKLRGELIEVEVVAREIERAIHNAKSILADIPEEFIDRLPAKFRERHGAKFRRWMQRRFRDAFDALAEMSDPNESESNTDPRAASE